jgi:hypothetical protein
VPAARVELRLFGVWRGATLNGGGLPASRVAS